METDLEKPSPSSPEGREPESSPNKRRKILTGPQTPTSPPISSSSKGKDKVCDGSEPVDAELQSCGICLSEDGKVIRGYIDSCNHFFCFVCIMEWAKVESRCPMCKRRFSTIRRPPRDGMFLTERVVNVPLRDQVYHYFGNATVEPSDPYSEVQCIVCNSSADESLLLLCDLCDSAAHTYCVGLGATVPEGDWFCQDCTFSKAEHDKSETDADCSSQPSFRNFHQSPLAEAHVSVFDIVREPSFQEVGRPFMTVLSRANEFSSPVSERRTSPADGMTEQSSRKHPTAAPPATEFSARTLRRCRDVRSHVQAFRENWNALRRGSLRFSSSSVNCADKYKRHGSGDLQKKSGQVHPAPCSGQQLAAKDGSSFDVIPNRSSYDVDKAWRMMEAAKSVERACGKNSFVRQASKLPINPNMKANSSSNILVSGSRRLGTRNPVHDGEQKHYQFHSDVKGNGSHKSQIVVKQSQNMASTGRILQCGENSLSSQSLGKLELPSSCKLQTSVQFDDHCRNSGKLLGENLAAALLDVPNEHGGSVCLNSPSRSVTVALSTSSAKLGVSSSSPIELAKGKARMQKSYAGSNSSRDDDAKSEIQSLVKLNLKLLSRDKKLGVDAFKQIARLATHSILAACGIEDPKPRTRSFSGTICCHANQGQQIRMSTLMPTSCRECFYAFVKDVVNTIMFEAIGLPL